jgi:hypothetical protein
MDRRHEFFHEPGADEFWSESWYMDYHGEAVQGHARVGFYPNRDQATVFAYVVHDDGGPEPAIYRVREEDVEPAATHGLHLEGVGWELSMVPEEPLEAWRLHLEGEATWVRGAEAAFEGTGDPANVAVDVKARGRHRPFPYGEGRDFPDLPGFGRYEQATHVTGEVDLEGETVAVDGPGERDHSWGRRRWTDGNTWVWASGGDPDGPAWNLLDLQHLALGEMVNGFWWDGETLHPLADVTVEADPALAGSTAEAWARGGPPDLALELAWKGGNRRLEGEVLGTTPLAWEQGGDEAIMVRSAVRWVGEGIEAAGWLEHKRPRG